jgi:hypothetical protein
MIFVNKYIIVNNKIIVNLKNIHGFTLENKKSLLLYSILRNCYNAYSAVKCSKHFLKCSMVQ